MTSTAQDPSPEPVAVGQEGRTRSAARRILTHLGRWWSTAALLLGAALVALVIGPFTHPDRGAPQVVLLGLVQETWLGLLAVLGLVLLSVAAPALVHRVLTLVGARGGWRDAPTWLAISAVGAFWVLAWMPVAFVLALSSEETRTIATVDGHELVVSRVQTMSGDNEMQAGFRSGLLVDFDATGDLERRGPVGPLSDWTFTVSVQGDGVVVRYGGGDDAGVLRLSRPTDG